MFDPVHLRSFLAVARTRSFTAAARRLNLRQSTVSQHVGKLELAAGRRLFLRDTHSVELTADGTVMVGFATSIPSGTRRRALLHAIRCARTRPVRGVRRSGSARASSDSGRVPSQPSVGGSRTHGGLERSVVPATARRPAGPGLREASQRRPARRTGVDRPAGVLRGTRLRSGCRGAGAAGDVSAAVDHEASGARRPGEIRARRAGGLCDGQFERVAGCLSGGSRRRVPCRDAAAGGSWRRCGCARATNGGPTSTSNSCWRPAGVFSANRSRRCVPPSSRMRIDCARDLGGVTAPPRPSSRQKMSTDSAVDSTRPDTTGTKHFRASSRTGTRAKPATAINDDQATSVPPPDQMFPI